MPVKVYNLNDECGTTGLFLGRGWELVDTLDKADILCLNGGEDIATEIYGQKPYFTSIPEHRSKRDIIEEKMYGMAVAKGKFILGICRGGQLANCLNGGKLYQHVNNHGTDHRMFDLRTEEYVWTTSAHHQMMIPGPDGEILAVAKCATVKIDDKDSHYMDPIGHVEDRDGQDPEVIWYPKTKSLCIQGHPEWAPSTNFASYCFKLIGSLRADGVWPSKAVTSMVAV